MSFMSAADAIIKILRDLLQGAALPSGKIKPSINMTTLTLMRTKAINGCCIFGTLTVGTYTCVTLENPEKVIPSGTYQITLYDSPHAGHKVPLLIDVPGRAEIEIHCGNVPEDSKGCILLGLTHDDNQLYDSRRAFQSLMPYIILPAQLVVQDAQPS